MIKKENGKYVLYSKDGDKKLGGPYETKEAAKEREREVQYFKHKNAEDGGVFKKIKKFLDK